MICKNCEDIGWVCELHTGNPWPRPDGTFCCSRPGMRCSDCNPCDDNTRQMGLAGFDIICATKH